MSNKIESGIAHRLIRFGKLSVLYENGFLRYVRAGDQEIIRMIYLALRNQDWETAALKITGEEIETNDVGFLVRYVGTNCFGDVEVFRWNIKIEGKNSGEITYEAKGEALSTFQRNRAGLCILHPIKSTLGQPVTITHPDGRAASGRFPEAISPHQPFLDIRKFKWQLKEGLSAELEFEGDIFETEDQRNWTDASFKTYSTPLSKPFPVTLHKGDTVHQMVKVRVGGLEAILLPDGLPEVIIVAVEEKQPIVFPRIGTCHTSTEPLPAAAAIAKIKALGFDHLRIDLNFSRSAWPAQWDRGLQEAALLDLPIELALLFDKRPKEEWAAFMGHFMKGSTQRVERLALFSAGKRTTPDELVSAMVPIVRAAFPNAEVGAGAAGYFVDVNRYPFQWGPLDFITYSLNPQVHASDDRTMVENVEAQGDSVMYAKTLTGKAIVVSPVTLRPRLNPDADVKPLSDQVLPKDVDRRQATAFAAAWTLASLKHLAERGVSAITFYESHGMKGFLLAQGDHVHDDFKNDDPVFPVYHFMESIHRFKPTHVRPSSTSDPLQLSSLVLANENEVLVAVANHTGAPLKFRYLKTVYEVKGNEIIYIKHTS